MTIDEDLQHEIDLTVARGIVVVIGDLFDDHRGMFLDAIKASKGLTCKENMDAVELQLGIMKAIIPHNRKALEELERLEG